MKLKNEIQTLHRLISKRRSIVSFSPEIPRQEEIDLLFQAASWAPSSRNQQPWRFLYTTKENPGQYDKFYHLLNPGNQEWAISAPVLVLSVAEVISDYKSKPNRFAFHDLGMAVGNLLFQATSMGLYVHQMGGYDSDAARIAFNIPDRFEPAAMLAIGYRGEIDNLPMELKRRELSKRTRKNIDEFVFEGKWKD